MKEIKTEDAIGSVLCHDITEIVKDQRKGPRFKKGHIIKEEDIEVLLNLGKEHLYVFEKDETMIHENDAAEILCNLCFNEYMKKSAISEGKIELTSTIDGLFKVNREELFKVNSFGKMMIATRQGNVPVKKGDKLAGMRIIPLVIEKEKMQQIQEKVQKPILKIMPYQIKTAGIITTGSEVYKGRIKDTFTPVIVEKLKEYGVEVTYHSLSLDDHEMTTSKINEALKQGVDLVLCTGGMSVDPDDKTPLAIKNTGAKIISYGAPVLPGAMFLLSYKGDVPIVGLPGCVMYSKRTVFDLILPRIMADDKVSAEDKSAIESALENLKAVKDKESATAEELKTAMDEVMNKFHKISEQMYQQAQAAQGAEAQDAGYDQGSNAGNGDDNVVDADFTEVDDK